MRISRRTIGGGELRSSGARPLGVSFESGALAGNEERIVARAWPASENRMAIAELTY